MAFAAVFGGAELAFDESVSSLVGGVDMMARSSQRQAKQLAMRLETQDPSFDDGDCLDVMQCKMRRRKVDGRAETQSRRSRMSESVAQTLFQK